MKSQNNNIIKYYKVNILFHGKKVNRLIEAKSKQELYNLIFSQYPKCKILKIRETSEPKLQ